MEPVAWMIAPPIAFLVLVALIAGLTRASARLAAPPVRPAPGKRKAYACGEDVRAHRMQPDYGQFFPFAFAFTILHVAALVVAAGPRFGGFTALLAVAWLVVAATGLTVLLRGRTP